jgi:hypothetical protein
MNCRDCREFLQRYLDGESVESAQAELAHHLTECADCRELHAAAGRLKAGLRLFVPPVPPPGLAGQIALRLLTEGKRVRRSRRAAAGFAVAAGLLLAAFPIYYAFRPAIPPGNPESIRAENTSIAPQPAPSLRRSVEEASQAMVSLTRRAADETFDQGRILLPIVLPAKDVSEALDMRPVPGPSEQPLADLKQGMAAGLEPVTSSARRAVNLFLREISPTGTERKEGT